MNFQRKVWSLVGWSCVCGGLMAAGALLANVARGEGYAVPLLTVPIYGAGAAPAASEAVAADQPEWAKRLESKLDKVLKLLEELDDKTPPPATGANEPAGELFFRADLSAGERERVAKKVDRGQMPPKEAEQLTPDEKTAIVAAFRGQKADDAALGSAGGKCVTCHSPAAAKVKGDNFQLFESRKK